MSAAEETLSLRHAAGRPSCRRACDNLLGGVGVGQRDGEHADVLLRHKVGIEVRQPHQS